MKNRFWLHAEKNNFPIVLFIEDLKKGSISPFFVKTDGSYQSMKIDFGAATNGGYKSQKSINIDLPISKIENNDVHLISSEQLETLIKDFQDNFKVFQTDKEYHSRKKANAQLELIRFLQPESSNW